MWVLSYSCAGFQEPQGDKLRPTPFFMNIFDRHEEFYDNPIFLSEEDKNNPLQNAIDYFGGHTLSEIRGDLANLLECALTSDMDCFADAKQRKAITYSVQRIEELLEAVYLLTLKHGKGIQKETTRQKSR